MPPRTHSILAPSSKEWFHCGLAAKFLATKDESETNDMAEFGTECHALAEAYIRQSLKFVDFDEGAGQTADQLKATFKHYSEEMEKLANGYANFVIENYDYEARRTGQTPVVLLEQLLEMDYAPDTHGTLDCGIIAGDMLTVIDNKTGYLKVTAEENGELNSQLAIYGLYAYKCYKGIYPIRQIRLVIYQERIHNISEISVTADELEKWERERLIPAARNALSENPVSASGWWCRYCSCRAVCRQRYDDALGTVGEMKQADFLTDAEIEALLPKLDNLVAYAESVKEYALKKAVEQGRKWQGFKLVESVTKRKILDEAEVGRVLLNAGYDPYTRKLMTISEIQKLVGKAQFENLVGAFVGKPKGQPVLVPEGDARTEINIKGDK